MSEIKYSTYIGEDVDVIVYFEHYPEERQTLNYPGCYSSIEINGIYCAITGKDFEGIIRDDVIDKLKIECFEHVNELADNARGDV